MGFVASSIQLCQNGHNLAHSSLEFSIAPLKLCADSEFASASFSSRRPTSQPLLSIAEAAPSGVKSRRWRLYKVKPDGKCMFRALAQGMSRNQGDFLNVNSEEVEADQLKLAVADVLCGATERRGEFADATYNIEHGGSGDANFNAYCRRIQSEGFWGGAAELSALSQLLKVPITVYRPDASAISGYEQIVVYGQQYTIARTGGKSRRMVNLLYSSGNHYDLLV